jgi:isopenicillin N synthase-like dioxygenase
VNAKGANASIPVFDRGRLDSDAEGQQPFLADLRSAARQVGFFYIVRHGIDPDSLARPIGG